MKSLTIPPLVEGAAILRALRKDDLALTMAWRNHPASRQWFHSDSEIAWDDHVAWFERYLERDDDYVFILTIDEIPVAQVSLYDIAAGDAEFGRLLVDPDARGRGIGGLASRLCLQVADELMNLKSLRLEVKEDNQTAIRIYRELGFSDAVDSRPHEGSILMRRQSANVNGA